MFLKFFTPCNRICDSSTSQYLDLQPFSLVKTTLELRNFSPTTLETTLKPPLFLSNRRSKYGIQLFETLVIILFRLALPRISRQYVIRETRSSLLSLSLSLSSARFFSTSFESSFEILRSRLLRSSNRENSAGKIRSAFIATRRAAGGRRVGAGGG